MELDNYVEIQAHFDKKPEIMTLIKEKLICQIKCQRKISNNGPLVGDA
jgi:hypothetical protein